MTNATETGYIKREIPKPLMIKCGRTYYRVVSWVVYTEHDSSLGLNCLQGKNGTTEKFLIPSANAGKWQFFGLTGTRYTLNCIDWDLSLLEQSDEAIAQFLETYSPTLEKRTVAKTQTQSQLIKKILKGAFPSTTFSVTYRPVYGYSVKWEDGPEESEVKPIIDAAPEVTQKPDTYDYHRSFSDALRSEIDSMLKHQYESCNHQHQKNQIFLNFCGKTGMFAPCCIITQTQEALDSQGLNEFEVVATQNDWRPETRITRLYTDPNCWLIREFKDGVMTEGSSYTRFDWTYEEAYNYAATKHEPDYLKELPSLRFNEVAGEYFTQALSSAQEQYGTIEGFLWNYKNEPVEMTQVEAQIQAVATVSPRDWDRFCYHLQAPREWLQPYGGDGNHSLDLSADGAYMEACRTWTREQWAEYRKTSFRGVVMVTDGDRVVYVDPRQFSHAETLLFPASPQVAKKVIADLTTKTVNTEPRLSSGRLAPVLNLSAKRSVSIPQTDQVTVTLKHNEEKNGIEIHFSSKPDSKTLKALGASVFRYHSKNEFWYAKRNDATISFAQDIARQFSHPDFESTQAPATETETGNDTFKVAIDGNEIEITHATEFTPAQEAELLEAGMDKHLSAGAFYGRLDQFQEFLEEFKAKWETPLDQPEEPETLMLPAAPELESEESLDQTDVIEPIEILSVDIWGEVTLPEMNCNDTVEQNDRYIEEEPREEECNIKEIVVLSPADYHRFSNSLLADQEWLKGKGGTSSHFMKLDDYMDFYKLSEEDQAQYIRESYLEGVIVTDKTRSIVIDPQCYNYARYAGHPSQELEAQALDQFKAETTPTIELDHTIEIIATTQTPDPLDQKPAIPQRDVELLDRVLSQYIPQIPALSR